MMDWDAFFEVHAGLPRQGPGTAEEVGWAVDLAGVPDTAHMLDAGCGPGADTATLRALRPCGTILSVDTHAPFLDELSAHLGDDPGVTTKAIGMEAAEGPFDLIWCAGALYFLGLEPGLRVLWNKLTPGGALAFSEPCYFVDAPSDQARAFWDGYPTRGVDDILDVVQAQGLTVLGHRPVPDAGWEAYYQPMEARIAALQGQGRADLSEVMAQSLEEAAQWRRVRAETGYLLVVARRN